MSLKRAITIKNAGFTLVEVGIAAVLGAMLMGSALMLVADQLRMSSAQASGEALATLNTAVSEYEAKFAINLANHTAVPIPGYANVGNPYAPTTTELFELGFLKTPVPTNIYGVSISQTVTNGTPSGMVWIIQPFTNNLNQPSLDLAGAAMIAAGGDAAFSSTLSPTVVEGADGWTAANPETNTPAVVAMRNGAGSAAFVRLDGSTPMQGSLSFNNYNLTNVGTLGASTGSITGTLTTGALTTGSVAAGSGGISSTGNIASNGTLSGSTLTATAQGNDVFFGSSALYSDGWNTVIRNTGGALYVQDFSGNAKPVVASQLITPGGNGVQIGSSNYYGDSTNSAIYQNGSLFVQTPGGAYAPINAGNINANGILVSYQYQTAGTGCSPNGAIANSGSGPLFCINGVWAAPGGGRVYMTAYNIPTNTTNYYIGNHLYCAVLWPGGYSWGEGTVNGYVGNNAYGSPLYSFSAWNNSSNGVTFTCLDQE